jgi:hypothetical protein
MRKLTSHLNDDEVIAIFLSAGEAFFAAKVSSFGRECGGFENHAFTMMWSVDRSPLGKRWAGIDGSVLQDG